MELQKSGTEEEKRVSGDNEHGAAALYSQQQAYITYLFYILTYLLTYLFYIGTYFVSYLLANLNS